MGKETTTLGSIHISPNAIASVAYHATLQSYGVVGLAPKNLAEGLPRCDPKDSTFPWQLGSSWWASQCLSLPLPGEYQRSSPALGWGSSWQYWPQRSAKPYLGFPNSKNIGHLAGEMSWAHRSFLYSIPFCSSAFPSLSRLGSVLRLGLLSHWSDLCSGVSDCL